MFCGVAASPAMMAAGSPGAKCSSRKTQTATMHMTGRIDAKRRAMVPLMPEAPCGCGWRAV